MKYYRIGCFCFLLLITLVITGCGPRPIKTEKVTGTVTLDGKPLPGATVGFIPKSTSEGNSGYAVTDDDGKFVLQTTLGAAGAGTTVGEYSVTVTKTDMIKTGTGKNDEGKVIDIQQPKDILPLVYANPTKSPFQVTVQSGENTFDFELKSKP